MNLTITCSSDHQPVAFAAQELADYLGRMLPGTAAVDTPGEGDLVFSLSVSHHLGPEKPERFAVHVTRTGGAITANCPLGVLLGVYDYLHYLGCRFLGPGKASEVVPVISAEALPAEYEKKASFRHRGVCIEGANSAENILDFIDWLPKAGYNSFFLQFKVPYTFLARWYHHERSPFLPPESYTAADAAEAARALEAELKKRGLLLHKVGHGWTGEVLGCETVSWDLDPRPLAEDKRPLAAMVDGVRGLSHGIPANTNLCLSSPKAADDFASLVVDYARANPSVDYLHVWLADEYNNVCECDGCRRTTPSDQYVALLNEIDRRLTAEGLDTRLVFLLYQELLWPPVRERLKNPDRFVLMFAPISRTFEASYDLSGPEAAIPPYERNRIVLPTDLRENLAFLRGWQRLFHGESFVYDYPLGRAHYGDFGYVHIAQVIGSDIKRLRRMGLDGYISCQELRVSLPNALPNYVMGRTLFDETADTEALIQEYFSAAYGESAGEVLDFLRELSRLSSCDYLNGKGPRTDPEMARRMEQVIRCIQGFPAARLKGGNDLFRKLLGYHMDYILALARAMKALAEGDPAGSRAGWSALRELIGRNEPEYQPYLDVYRVLEVTSKYTGFPPVNDE